METTYRTHVEAIIRWTPDDVAHLCPELNDEECAEALARVRSTLIDRSVELGWDVLEVLLNAEGYIVSPAYNED